MRLNSGRLVCRRPDDFIFGQSTRGQLSGEKFFLFRFFILSGTKNSLKHFQFLNDENFNHEKFDNWKIFWYNVFIGGDKVIKLDYSLQTPEERNELVQQILANPPENGFSNAYLEVLADYLILCMEKQERKERKILTDNRLATVNKRETSYEGLVAQFENGEDGIYGIMTEDKNQIFQPKVSITQKDLDEIPALKQLKESINYWEQKMQTAEGRDALIIKKTLIELRKDQYIIKNAYRKPIVFTQAVHSSKNYIPLEGEVIVNEEGRAISKGVTLLDPVVCSAILCNYSKLKQDSWGNFESDTWYLIYDFENICDKALADYPLYMRIVEYKIDGLQNIEIQEAIQQEFGIKHSLEYISSLWRKKIPQLIASTAEDEYLDWYYMKEQKGIYKRCSRCGTIKLANNKYFSLNNTSKDGFYSICKKCRSIKVKKT